MNKRAPAFQFYPGDYLSDVKVQLLTLEEEGCYIRLLAYCWLEGSVPADSNLLAKLCKGCSTDITTVVARLFQPSSSDDSRLVHGRLDDEREKQRIYREQQSNAGKSSAKARARAKVDNHSLKRPLEQSLNVRSTLQSSSSSSTSQLAGELANEDSDEAETVSDIQPSSQVLIVPMGKADVYPDIVHEIYRHYPVHVHDQESLAAIYSALDETDHLTLLQTVKAFAEEVRCTNTLKPTWATKWFAQKMWKSYLPVPDATIVLDTENDQNLSPQTDEFYQQFNH